MFTLGDVQLFAGTTRLDISSAPDTELNLARVVLLTFATQKNGMDNKVIKTGLSGDQLVCVVKVFMRRICYL